MRDSSLAVAVREWADEVPEDVRRDALWRVEAYRLGLYVCDVAWDDVTALSEDVRTRSLADQLHRALGSISANLAEGYSRGGGRDRARFLEYALGSAREARDWYVKGRHVLNEGRVESQVRVLTSVIRLLLVMTRDQRDVHLREPGVPYDLDVGDPDTSDSVTD
jgi:four helix bundle protein